LAYPVANGFDAQDEKKFKNLVVWLEDQKIRQYQVEERDAIRNTEASSWPATFATYLVDVGCPFDPTMVTRPELADWLLALAVRLEYADNVDKFAKASAENVRLEKSQAPEMVTANPLDKLDFSSPDFSKAVDVIAEMLEITKHPNHLVTLEAIVNFVKKRMNQDVVKDPSSVIPKGIAFPIQEADMGFDTGDYVLNLASKILRLLYIHDVRDLQTKINECIVSVQHITANPKTDTALGKVGR